MIAKTIGLLHLGITALNEKKILEAKKYFELAIANDESSYTILTKVGTSYAQNGFYLDAKNYLAKALELQPNDVTICHNLGLIFSIQGDNEEALKYYDQALKADSNNIETLINKAAALNELRRYEEVVVIINNVIAVNPSVAEAWSNLGIAYRHLKKYKEALEAYSNALEINPHLTSAIYNKGLAHNSLKQFSKALECFEIFTQACPNNSQGWLYLAVSQEELNNPIESLNSYDQGLAIDPNYPEAWSNRGNLLAKLCRHLEAIQSFDTAIRLRPDYCDAWVNKGHTLFEIYKHSEALICYQKAFVIDPNFDYLLGSLIHSYMRVCDWSATRSLIKNLLSDMPNGGKLITPFFALGITDSLLLQKKSAEVYSKDTEPQEKIPLFVPRNKQKKKIRIGYLSSDFRTHAVAILTAEIFELHDRNRFEIYGFSSGPKVNDEMQKRLRNSFDQFIEVELMSDQEIAEKFRSLEIDIAIDLGGFTNRSRTRALSYRAAPIQVSYLGFPGTMGSNYIVGDQTIIPEELKSGYSEKIIYLPNSYQANDSKRKISEKIFLRQEFSLPNDSFVFCCFNNPYKITPNHFSSWMTILENSPNSILWLLEDEIEISRNLRAEAQKVGIDPNRLIFSGRLPPDEYLARYRLADLFLDTHPFNAGTTTSDALWAGLPVLTYMGEAFASRMSGSLLSTLRLPELIASSREDYINLAIEFATRPEKLILIRNKLASNRGTTPLFDTRLFVKHLENGLSQAFEHHRNNLMPIDIKISQ
jgi:protein O-GlcNAc transferase